jgi:hypothetical protein
MLLNKRNKGRKEKEVFRLKKNPPKDLLATLNFTFLKKIPKGRLNFFPLGILSPPPKKKQE